MFKLIGLMFVVVAFIQINAEESKLTTEKMIMTTEMKPEQIEEGELPCLNKAVGATMPHPGDVHKFLRCVSFDTLWVEACPSNLVYNQWLGLCDWNNDKPTTAMPTTPGFRTTTEKPFYINGKRLIKGFNWLNQLKRAPVVVEDDKTEKVQLKSKIIEEIKMTTTPEMMIEIESTTPEVIAEDKVALSESAMDKIKTMIKKVETTTRPVIVETVETTDDLIKKGEQVMKPVVQLGKDAVKVILSKETLSKIQNLIHKTV